MGLGAVLSSRLGGIDAFRPIKATVHARVIGIVAIGVLSVVIALLIPANYLNSFNNFVLLMLYFLVPWTAVNLVDFYAVRHGEYAITDIFRADGVYGNWSRRGLVGYGIGFVAMIPFFSLPGFYPGPIAERLNGADISFAIGLVIAGGLYYVFSRNLDREAESRARAASQLELEGTPVQNPTQDPV